jgi:hypothetical protein
MDLISLDKTFPTPVDSNKVTDMGDFCNTCMDLQIVASFCSLVSAVPQVVEVSVFSSLWQQSFHQS